MVGHSGCKSAVLNVCALAVVLAIGLTGCADDGNEGGGGLVLGTNQAWVDEDGWGFVFLSNNIFLEIEATYYNNGPGYLYESIDGGYYTINGNILKLDYGNGYIEQGEYRILGNTALFTVDYGQYGVWDVEFTKQYGVDLGGGGGKGGNLILSSGYAWTGKRYDDYDDYTYGFGIIFNADHTVTTIVDVGYLFGYDETMPLWVADEGNTQWSTNGGVLIVESYDEDYDEWDASYVLYTASGSGLTIEHTKLTKTGNVYPISIDDLYDMFLKRGDTPETLKSKIAAKSKLVKSKYNAEKPIMKRLAQKTR